jgi:hypothetical protein
MTDQDLPDDLDTGYSFVIQTEDWVGEENKWRRIIIDINTTEVVKRGEPLILMGQIFDHVWDEVTEKMPDLENFGGGS